MQVLKFSTPSCGQCRVVDQVLKKNNIIFTSIDCTTDDGEAIASKYDIVHVPTVLTIDNEGNVIRRITNLPSILSAIKSGVFPIKK